MNPLKKLDSQTTADGQVLELFERSGIFYLRVNGEELMSSGKHNSEEELSRLTCPDFASTPRVTVMIGGLGLGYTLRAALDLLRADARVVVAEIFPRVIEWNRSYLGHLAGHPLEDPRVTVKAADVADLLDQEIYDLILLDLDNGPRALAVETNSDLYSERGAARFFHALRRGGALGVWSVSPDNAFLKRMKKIGFHTRCQTVRARSGKKDAHHTIIIGKRT